MLADYYAADNSAKLLHLPLLDVAKKQSHCDSYTFQQFSYAMEFYNKLLYILWK